MNLSDLQNALAPLSNIGAREKTVEVLGVQVCLRTLTPVEEGEIQKAIPSADDGDISPLEFLDTFRSETLSRCIIQVGDLNLRGVDYLPTGEMLPSGVEKKISKADAVKEIVEKWPRPILNVLFEAFSSLAGEVETELNEKLGIDESDPEAELQAVEERAKDIRKVVESKAQDKTVEATAKVVKDAKVGGLTSILEDMD